MSTNNGNSKLESSVRTFTPTEAAAILATRNNINRPLAPNRVDHYRKEMLRGNWKLNGESIVFSTDGQLLDGQHRLAACVKADIPFTSLVVTGVEPHLFYTFDGGKSRSFADTLATERRSFPAITSASYRLLWAFEFEQWQRQIIISNADLLDYMTQHPALASYCTGSGVGAHLLSPRVYSVARYITDQKFKEEAAEFWTQFDSGIGLTMGNPIFALRTRSEGDLVRRVKHDPNIMLGMVARTWNAWLKGAKMNKMVAFPKGEKIPIDEFIGYDPRRKHWDAKAEQEALKLAEADKLKMQQEVESATATLDQSRTVAHRPSNPVFAQRAEDPTVRYRQGERVY